MMTQVGVCLITEIKGRATILLIAKMSPKMNGRKAVMLFGGRTNRFKYCLSGFVVAVLVVG